MSEILQVRCTLSWTCQRRKRKGICCATCGIHDTCLDACENSPERCMVSREPVARELANEYGMKSIRLLSYFRKIEETGQPLGLFYKSNDCYSRAIDNRTGTPVSSEDFATTEEAIRWLANRVDADEGRSSEC